MPAAVTDSTDVRGVGRRADCTDVRGIWRIAYSAYVDGRSCWAASLTSCAAVSCWMQAAKYQVQQTDVFSKWLAKLKDRRAVARILARLESVRLGNIRDAKSLGRRLYELRIHSGPGYRLYFTMRSDTIGLLLVGGSESRQESYVDRARKLLQEIG